MYFNNAYKANPAWRYGPATRQGVPLLAIAAGGDAAECRMALGRMSQKERAASVARALEEVHHLLSSEMLDALSRADVAAVRAAAKTAHDAWWALYAQKTPPYNTRSYWEGVHARRRAYARRLAAAAALSAVADSTPQSAWETIALADEALNT